jgi:succinyl-diaminopimelate desuccinylase
VGAARQGGAALVFAGHTDVVPADRASIGKSIRSRPTSQTAQLIGRGAADMKGSLAAMIDRVPPFAERYPKIAGSIGC